MAAGEKLPSLLAVCTAAPWPVRDGYTLRVHGLLRELAAHWAITLVAPDGPEAPGIAAHIPVALAGNGLSYPWRFDPRDLVRAVEQAGPHDRALVWPGAEAVWFGRPGLPPAVMDMIDCNPLEFWRGTLHAPGLRERLRNLRQIGVATRFARRTVRRYSATVCVGEADAVWLRRIGGRDSVHVVPNGVDLPEAPVEEAATPVLSFVGTLDFPPNVDAALHAATAIWPRVRAAIPEAFFVIAGRRPTAQIRALHGQAGIVVAADVADMATVLGRSWVSVAPMRSGVGIKNKVLEAWACARPVVLTPMATNGLTLPPGHAALVHAGADDMAEAIISLMRDDAARCRLGRSARLHVRENFSWAGAAGRLNVLLREAASERE